jgi:hypothetical protein
LASLLQGRCTSSSTAGVFRPLYSTRTLLTVLIIVRAAQVLLHLALSGLEDALPCCNEAGAPGRHRDHLERVPANSTRIACAERMSLRAAGWAPCCTHGQGSASDASDNSRVGATIHEPSPDSSSVHTPLAEMRCLSSQQTGGLLVTAHSVNWRRWTARPQCARTEHTR